MNKEKMKKIIMNLTGGEFPQWYISLSKEGKKLYKISFDEIRSNWMKDKKSANG